MKNNLQKGLSLAFTTAMISGVSNFVNKIAVTGIQPLVLTSLKNSLVFIMIAAVFLLFSKREKLQKLTKKDYLKLIAVGVIGGALPFYLFFTALSQMPAISAALIHKSLVVWVALLAVPLLKEKFTSYHATAIILLFGSNFLIGGFTGFKFSAPELMVLAATLLWAVENIIAKIALKTIDPLIVAGARMGIGSILLFSAAVLSGQAGSIATLSLSAWGMIAITALLLFGYATTWYSALKYTSVINVASILVSATIFTNILSAIFITHSLSIEQFYQSVMISAALGFLLWANRKESKLSSRIYTTIGFVAPRR